MRLLTVVCTVLLALSAPALAQDAPDGGGPGVSPGTLGLIVAGGVLAGFGLGYALKKDSNPTPFTCANKSIAVTTC